MQSFFDYQTQQIKRQWDHVTRANAVRQMREGIARQNYESNKITWDEYQIRMTEIADLYMVEERKSYQNYKEAIESWINEQT